MYFFLVLLGIATIEIITTRWSKFEESFQKQGILILGGIGVFLSLGIVAYPHTSLQELFFGIGEKQHGLLFPLGLIWLAYLTSLLHQNERKKVFFALIFSGIFVALVALIESRGANIFTGASYTITGSWGDIRSTSTLGNPNYVAGYLLMLLPLVRKSEKKWQYFLLPILLLGILVTKSVIGLSIALSYLVYLLMKKRSKIYTSTTLPLLVLLLIGGAYLYAPESEKWLSLISRFILMKHTIIGAMDGFWSLLIGHGPDSIVRFFSGIRPDEIVSYFPEGMIIDSSHNILIDILMAYGIIGCILFIRYIASRWHHLDTFAKQGIVLGLAFLSLNVLVVSHMILLVFFLSCKKVN